MRWIDQICKMKRILFNLLIQSCNTSLCISMFKLFFKKLKSLMFLGRKNTFYPNQPNFWPKNSSKWTIFSFFKTLLDSWYLGQGRELGLHFDNKIIINGFIMQNFITINLLSHRFTGCRQRRRPQKVTALACASVRR